MIIQPFSFIFRVDRGKSGHEAIEDSGFFYVKINYYFINQY
jgi:hypothetical protein